jgi:hypothetical protein
MDTDGMMVQRKNIVYLILLQQNGFMSMIRIAMFWWILFM